MKSHLPTLLALLLASSWLLLAQAQFVLDLNKTII